MTINLANNNPRIEYSVAQGVTQQTFAVPFEFFDDGDLSVYVDGILKAEGTDYTTTGGDGSTGTIVFVTATPPDVQQVTGATGGSQVVIVRNIPIERTSDFSAGADINRAALNEQLDIITAMLSDLKSKIDRSPTLFDYDVVEYQLTIPVKAERLNKYLAFGADGNLTVASGTSSDIIVSAFGETLVDDVNAATALQTLGLTASAAELNILDGVTASTSELNILDGVTASTSELNILDGVTASAAELNILDGATLTVTELNYVDGVTSAIQAQLNTKYDSDDLASQAEAQAGTDNTKLMTPLRAAQAISVLSTFTKEYVSSNQTITSAGLLTLAHSLGEAPKVTQLELICTVADGGYAVNDVVAISFNNTDAGNNRYSAVYYDATNIFVRYSSTATAFAVANKGTGVAVTLTNTSWRLRVRAFA